MAAHLPAYLPWKPQFRAGLNCVILSGPDLARKETAQLDVSHVSSILCGIGMNCLVDLDGGEFGAS